VRPPAVASASCGSSPRVPTSHSATAPQSPTRAPSRSQSPAPHATAGAIFRNMPIQFSNGEQGGRIGDCAFLRQASRAPKLTISAWILPACCTCGIRGIHHVIHSRLRRASARPRRGAFCRRCGQYGESRSSRRPAEKHPQRSLGMVSPAPPPRIGRSGVDRGTGGHGQQHDHSDERGGHDRYPYRPPDPPPGTQRRGVPAGSPAAPGTCSSSLERHTGVRVEELLELSHHSLVQYRLPSTGGLVPLLQITPSKTDADRLLPNWPTCSAPSSAASAVLTGPFPWSGPRQPRTGSGSHPRPCCSSAGPTPKTAPSLNGTYVVVFNRGQQSSAAGRPKRRLALHDNPETTPGSRSRTGFFTEPAFCLADVSLHGETRRTTTGAAVPAAGVVPAGRGRVGIMRRRTTSASSAPCSPTCVRSRSLRRRV
jgi:hypothetical protein